MWDEGFIIMLFLLCYLSVFFCKVELCPIYLDCLYILKYPSYWRGRLHAQVFALGYQFPKKEFLE